MGRGKKQLILTILLVGILTIGTITVAHDAATGTSSSHLDLFFPAGLLLGLALGLIGLVADLLRGRGEERQALSNFFEEAQAIVGRPSPVQNPDTYDWLSDGPEEERPTPADPRTSAAAETSDRATDDLGLEQLWKKNQELLLVYHKLAETQARSGYNSAQAATWLGLFVVIGTIGAAFLAPSGAASIAAGLVGASASAAAGYVGATYLKLQQSTKDQLRSYFDQPVELSRVLTAERLLRELPSDQRGEAALVLIRSLCGSPEPDTR